MRRRIIMAKKGMVAMLLAGGQGNRLYVLTKQIAKPVEFNLAHEINKINLFLIFQARKYFILIVT